MRAVSYRWFRVSVARERLSGARTRQRAQRAPRGQPRNPLSIPRRKRVGQGRCVSPTSRATGGGVDDGQDVDLGRHAIGDDAGCAGDDQRAHAGNPARPTNAGVIAELRNPTLDAIAQMPGCTGILPQHEVKMCSRSHAAWRPQTVSIRRRISGDHRFGPERVEDLVVRHPLSAALRCGVSGGRRRSVAGTSEPR